MNKRRENTHRWVLAIYGILKVSPKMDHSIRVKSKDPRIAGINHSEWKIKTRE